MASGTINGTFSGVSWAYPKIVWSSSTNVSANTSSVTAILYFVRTANYNSYNLNGHPVTMNVNGSASASRPFNLNASQVEVWRRTVTVSHSGDGSKSITIGASSSGTGNSLGSYNFSGTAVLDKIPRAFDFIVSTQKVALDTPMTVKITDNGSGFSPWLYYNFGGKRVSLGECPKGANFSITLKSSDLAGQIPNSLSGWGTLELETWTKASGGSKVGSKQIRVDVTVPANIVPTLDSLTSYDFNSSVTDAIGTMANTYIQGLSNIRFSANSAKGIYGSTIQKFTFSIGDWSVDHAGYQRDMNLKDKPTLTGTQTAKVVVTDSRGRTASKTLSINILPYSPPTLNITADRTAADQTKVLITPTGKVSSVKNGTTEKNTYTIKMEYKISTATTWTEVPNGTITSFEAVTLASVAKDKSYSLQVTLSDKFYTVVATQNISTTKVLLDLYKDTGIGAGKLYEEGHGVLDVGGAIYTSKEKHNFGGSTLGNAALGAISGMPVKGDWSTKEYWSSDKFPQGESWWWTGDGDGNTGKPVTGGIFVQVIKLNTEWRVMAYSHPSGGIYTSAGNNLTMGSAWYQISGKGKYLWTGDAFMFDSQTATPTVPLADCTVGWIIKWQWRISSGPDHQQFHYHLIPRTHTGGGVSMPMVQWSGTNKVLALKYLYTNGITIQGHVDNGKLPASSFTMTGVIGV